MPYFAKFPILFYSIDAGKTVTAVSDILRRIAVKQETKENFSLFEKYTIQDGETPETVSHKFYGDSEYHWVILLMNDIIDPRYEWPLTEAQLYDYVYNKYSGSISGVKHYTISETNTIVVDSDYVGAYPVTNLNYESSLNEAKRNIRILRSKYLSSFITEFEALVNG